MNTYKEEELKELIEAGFDIELISFELKVPIEKLKDIQQELKREKEPRKKQGTREQKEENPRITMEQIRERYHRLYLENNTEKVEQRKEIPKETTEKIEEIIEKVSEIISTMKGKEQRYRKEKVISILSNLKKIGDEPLSIEQAEKLYGLLQAEELKDLNFSGRDDMNCKVQLSQKRMAKRLGEAIDIAQSQTSDVEELQQLKRKITSQITKDNPLFVASIRSKIESKIVKISQEKVIYRIRNDIPESIKTIIREITQGTLDVEKAKKVIEEEAKRRVASNPKTKFSLTEEQTNKQILMQITIVLKDRPEQYSIQKPEVAARQIQKLSEISLESAIEVVVKNLIGVKDFERAKAVCDQFYHKEGDEHFRRTIWSLKKQIRNEEIGDMILRGINQEGNIKEEEFLELIEKGLNQKNIKLSTIPLGKSQDGLRTITLADIWEEKGTKAK